MKEALAVIVATPVNKSEIRFLFAASYEGSSEYKYPYVTVAEPSEQFKVAVYLERVTESLIQPTTEIENRYFFEAKSDPKAFESE